MEIYINSIKPRERVETTRMGNNSGGEHEAKHTVFRRLFYAAGWCFDVTFLGERCWVEVKGWMDGGKNTQNLTIIGGFNWLVAASKNCGCAILGWGCSICCLKFWYGINNGGESLPSCPTVFINLELYNTIFISRVFLDKSYKLLFFTVYMTYLKKLLIYIKNVIFCFT